ncbi:MAG: glycogen debranching N-terminal domain-containing protein [Chloroflexota bacterium]
MEIAINEGTTFLIVNRPGNVQPGSEYGLYQRDIRFLSNYALRLAGLQLITLTARLVDHQRSVHVLTNPHFGDWPQGSFVVTRTRTVESGLHEDLEITSYVDQFMNLEVQMEFDADFAHIFQVRGHVGDDETRATGTSSIVAPERPNDPSRVVLSSPDRHPGWLTEIRFSMPPEPIEPQNQPIWRIGLPGRGTVQLGIDFILHQPNASPQYPRQRSGSTATRAQESLARAEERFVRDAPRLETDSFPLKQAYDRALRDLAALRLKGEDVAEHENAIAAGIPWFMALFGRDALITGYQTLPYLPEISRGALKALAGLQGTRVDPVTQEEPGKILHEYRVDSSPGHEVLIPHFPYYGTIDATPLFLMQLREHYRWTGDIELVRSLWPAALRALEWLDAHGDDDGDGYIEYIRRGSRGLQNQGWKDSWDSVRFSDGKLAEPPIALCEVQGYAYAAKLGMAELADVLQEKGLANSLRLKAEQLRERFNRDFWSERRSTYVLALDGQKRQVDALASNAGHALWSGIAEPGLAAQVVRQLMSPAMFSGWGIRTMGSDEGGYNPIGYHTGTVWPHDTAMIADGFQRYGFYDEANALVEAVFASAEHFELYRLPELFGGYPRADFGFPVEYPTACSPQAWAAGAVPLLISTILGLRADAQERHIEIHPRFPRLSDPISYLRLSGLRIGDGELDIELQNINGEVRTTLRKVPRGFKVEGSVFHWSLFW